MLYIALVDIELAVVPGDLNKAIINSTCKHVLVLIPYIPMKDPYLKWMQDCLNVSSEPNPWKPADSWFEGAKNIVKLRNRFTSFIKIAAEHGGEKEVKYVVAHFSESQDDIVKDQDTKKSDNIYAMKLYINGNVEHFEIPGKPRLFAATVMDQDGHVHLQWKDPEFGHQYIKSYIVSYYNVIDSPNPEKTELEVRIIPQKNEENIVRTDGIENSVRTDRVENMLRAVTLDKLESGATYVFTVWAKWGEKSDEVTYTVPLPVEPPSPATETDGIKFDEPTEDISFSEPTEDIDSFSEPTEFNCESEGDVIEFMWKKPTVGADKVTHYVLVARPQRPSHLDIKLKALSPNFNDHMGSMSATMTQDDGLKPHTKYTCAVQAGGKNILKESEPVTCMYMF